MAQFHFIEDYEKLVARLVADHPIDEAMSRAVGGGDYAIFGHIEFEILKAADRSADMVSAFSLFTHLLQSETFIYLEECVRILKPGGRIVFSILEFAEPTHWAIFERTRNNARNAGGDHLDMFMERSAIDIWAAKLGLSVERYLAPSWKTEVGHALGQSVVILRK